jgi:hypothetical protein
MNFTPPLRPRQFTFAFIEALDEPEVAMPWERLGMGRTAYFTRRWMRRAVAAAYELGRRRRTATVPAPARSPRPFQPTRAEASELRAPDRAPNRLASITRPVFRRSI